MARPKTASASTSTPRLPLGERVNGENLPLVINTTSKLQTPFSPSEQSLKRPHSNIDDGGESSDDDDPRLRFITDNCDQVRRKIHNFINSGAMKVGEFQKAIGAGSGPYARFMKQNGPDAGARSDVYPAAFRFFKKRELEGIKMPRKKVKKAEEDKRMDVSDIHLDGEEDEAVEVYDTCDELRKKIAAFLREEGVTKAAFLRTLGKMFPEPKTIQSKQLQDFQSKNGPLAGNTSRVYYAAYVFFEKLRIKEGRKKSKVREETEDRWASEGGIQRKRAQEYYICRQGDELVQDKYGIVSINPRY